MADQKRVRELRSDISKLTKLGQTKAAEQAKAMLAKERAKDVEPVGAKKYVCVTKDGKRHDIEAENASAANTVAEKRFGYANISVPPQESLRAKDARPDPREDERWKQHMHEDGLWCGDVNCETCAKSGAMAKGVKEMKMAKDAEVKCAGCGTSSKTLYEDAKTGTHGGQFWCAGCGGRPVKGCKIVKATDEVKPVGAERLWRVSAPGVPARMIKAATEEDAIEKMGELFPNKFDPNKATAAARDASPFEVDTDAGAERIVRREAKAGLTAAQIARKHGFSLSFVKEVLSEVKPVGDAEYGPYTAKVYKARADLQRAEMRMQAINKGGRRARTNTNASEALAQLERAKKVYADIMAVAGGEQSET